jgi:hypothetical protein
MTNDLKEKLSQRKFKQDYQPKDENILFTINGKTIGVSQSIVVFSGLPKQGKTLFVTGAIATAYTTWDIFGMKLNFPKDRKRLCYIDTESSDYDYYKNLDRTRKQMLYDHFPHNFDSFLFREDKPADIMQMTEIYLSDNKDCSILVIDGILDLISDFNSVEQSFYLIQWLKKITKVHDLLIICVLHLGKKDQNSIGHIGSYLDRKANAVLRIEKNKEQKTIDLHPTFLRSTDDFDPISIQYQGNEWQQIHTEKKSTGLIYGMEKKSLISRILVEPRKYNDIVNDLAEFTGKSTTTAKKIIKEWIEKSDIIKVGELYKQK